jgi:hypothetical protein
MVAARRRLHQVRGAYHVSFRHSFICIIATALVGGTAFMPTPAEAAKMSKADRVALKEATVACKAEARGKKVKWLARRKFVNNCVARALKDHPNIGIIQLRREHPDLKGLPGQQPSEWGCPDSC